MQGVNAQAETGFSWFHTRPKPVLLDEQSTRTRSHREDSKAFGVSEGGAGFFLKPSLCPAIKIPHDGRCAWPATGTRKQPPNQSRN